MSTGKDVAMRAGVSVATVSRAFHDDARVRPETRELIMHAARELNYTPNLIARGLKNKHSRTVGILVSDIDNPWYMPVIKNMEKILREEDYRLLIMFDDGQPDCEQEALYQMAAAQVDGIMFTPQSRRSHDTVQMLIKQGVSLMELYTHHYDNLTCIEIDDRYGVYLAVRYLLRQGYRRILNIGPGYLESYSRAYEEERVPVDMDMCIHAFDKADPYPTIVHTIEQVRPDAILAIADRMGRNTVKALKHLNLSIPKDVGLLVYDDLSWVSMMDISAISQPIDVVAETAVRQMLHIIRSEDVRGLVTSSIRPFMIPRGSTPGPQRTEREEGALS